MMLTITPTYFNPIKFKALAMFFMTCVHLKLILSPVRICSQYKHSTFWLFSLTIGQNKVKIAVYLTCFISKKKTCYLSVLLNCYAQKYMSGLLTCSSSQVF